MQRLCSVQEEVVAVRREEATEQRKREEEVRRTTAALLARPRARVRLRRCHAAREAEIRIRRERRRIRGPRLRERLLRIRLLRIRLLRERLRGGVPGKRLRGRVGRRGELLSGRWRLRGPHARLRLHGDRRNCLQRRGRARRCVAQSHGRFSGRTRRPRCCGRARRSTRCRWRCGRPGGTARRGTGRARRRARCTRRRARRARWRGALLLDRNGKRPHHGQLIVAVVALLTFALRFHAGDDGERLPAVHAFFPDGRVSGDDVETKRVVELIERHRLDVVPGNGNVPDLVCRTRSFFLHVDVREVGRAVRLPIHVRLKRCHRWTLRYVADVTPRARAE